MPSLALSIEIVVLQHMFLKSLQKFFKDEAPSLSLSLSAGLLISIERLFSSTAAALVYTLLASSVVRSTLQVDSRFSFLLVFIPKIGWGYLI